MIWAANSHVVALDNLSSMPVWLSDAMCRLATGGGHSERALYSDDAEKLFFAVRPQIVNGIGEIIKKSDFLDRALIVTAPVVAKSARKPEKELDERFAAVYASIFGAILTAASHGLKRLPEVERMNHDLPRLADLGKWMMAVESALGWKAGEFVRAITRNEQDAHESAVAGSIFASTVRKFVLSRNEPWDGTWEELRGAVDKFAGEGVKRQEGWPRNNHDLSTKLRERAPNLRGVGIDVQFHDNKRPKRVTLTNTLAPPQQASCEGSDATSSGTGVPPGTEPIFQSRPRIACFDFDQPDKHAQSLYDKAWRFWMAPPLPVAAPTFALGSCDGAQVPAT
jgi:hypothetical protein